MTVAGLHNVSPFAPSFFDESQPTFRTSSLLQMWRELENKHLMSSQSCSNRPGRRPRNGSDTKDFEYEESNSIMSQELGETERKRVRRIFQEWMRSGSKRDPSSGLCLYNHSDVCERMHEGPVAIRPIRKLCGRQTVLDLLTRSQSERKRELLCLDKQKPVSKFVHRNRIQALLRGRFLRNEKPVLDERSTSRAATELSLLRLRQTVSDLKKGFISKLDSSASNSLNSAELHYSFCSHESNVESESTFREEEEATDIHETSDSKSGNTNSQTESGKKDMPHALFARDLTIANESEEVNYYSTYHGVTDGNYEESDSRDVSSQLERFHGPVMEIEGDVSRDEEEGCAYVKTFDNNNVEEHEDQIHESRVHLQGHDLHQAIDTFYPLDDDDNACNMGLKELFSRRIVSSLLGSGFRERLNWVLQSHAKRMAHVSGGHEPEDVSLTEGDQEQINRSDETLVLSDGAETNPFVFLSTLFATASQPLWDEEYQASDYITQPKTHVFAET